MTKVNVGTWNLESGDSDVRTLAKQVKDNDFGLYDIWGYSEVKSGSVLRKMADALAEDTGDDFETILGDTQSSDKLGIAYNTKKYELILETEIDTMDQGNPSHRDTLVGEFKHIDTGQRIIFAVNHFARGNGALRREQAKIFNLWAIKQPDSQQPAIQAAEFPQVDNFNLITPNQSL